VAMAAALVPASVASARKREVRRKCQEIDRCDDDRAGCARNQTVDGREMATSGTAFGHCEPLVQGGTAHGRHLGLRDWIEDLGRADRESWY
jgi:hypothetical protein